MSEARYVSELSVLGIATRFETNDAEVARIVEEAFGMWRSLAADDAYSLASVAVDVGVTQVVDGRLGCHASIAKSILS